MSDTQERWEVYPSRVQDKFAMFAVNLGVAEEAPFSNLRWLNVVRIPFRATASGMPSDEANATLYAIEDLLHAQAASRGGMQVGRLTVGGRREFFLYTATNDAELVTAEIEKKFPDVEVEAFSREDSEWEVYFDFLFPTPVDFRRIDNQRVVRALAEHGDDPTLARDVDHFAYFPSAEARRTFRDEILAGGFTVDYEEEGDSGELRFGIAFRSHGPVDLSSVDQVTIPLFVRADELGGSYDGWGCAVTKAIDEG